MMIYAQPTPRTSCHRNIIAVDIEGSTSRPDPIKAHLREVMYELVEQALHAGGLVAAHRDPLIDRGDGVLVLLHPVDRAPKRVLLDTVMPSLGALLTEHNECHPAWRFRLRAVVHAGEIHYDAHGCFGEVLDVAFRLLDAEKVKRTLRVTPAPLALVVSDDIYRGVVLQGYHGIDAGDFKPLVRLHVAGRWHRGWVRAVDPVAVPYLPPEADTRVTRLAAYASPA
jgi:hypothetical protein